MGLGFGVEALGFRVMTTLLLLYWCYQAQKRLFATPNLKGTTIDLRGSYRDYMECLRDITGKKSSMVSPMPIPKP